MPYVCPLLFTPNAISLNAIYSNFPNAINAYDILLNSHERVYILIVRRSERCSERTVHLATNVGG